MCPVASCSLHSRSPASLAYDLYPTRLPNLSRASRVLSLDDFSLPVSTMPILSRTVLLGFQAAALIATVGQAPLATLAVPIPVPMPLMPHMADYASQPPFRNNTSIVPQTQVFSTSRRDLDAAVVDHTASYTSPIERRQDMGSVVPGLQEHSDNLRAHNLILSADSTLTLTTETMAAEPGDNKELLQGLSDSIMNLLAGVKTNPVLSDATASKGLANYDPNNDLETAIKEAINSIKSTLDEVVGLLDIDIAGIDLGGSKLQFVRQSNHPTHLHG